MTVAYRNSLVLEYTSALNRKIGYYPLKMQGGAEHGKAL